jgi:hypothetical protein
LRDQVYGFPCVENSHDFRPDEGSCTPEEIAFWEDAKKRWDAGERDVRGKRCQLTFDAEGNVATITRSTSWGIGVNTGEWDDDEEAE